MVRIVLADDHPIVRHGMRILLENQPQYEVIGEADDGLSAVRTVEQLKPDVLVVDLMMPGLNGLEVIKRVQKRFPQIRIVVLTMHFNEPYVLEAMRSGASAYVLKTTSTNNLVDAVQAVMSGNRYLSPPITERAIEAYIQKAGNTNSEVDRYKMLTSREREVFQLAAEGLSNQEIAQRLAVSPRTAETHRTNIMRKLEIHSQTDLVEYANQQGFIQGA